MSSDFEEEAPIMTSVGELLPRRATKRNPTKHKRPRVVSEFLLARLPLVADKLNSLEVFQSALRDSDGWEDGAKRRTGRLPNGRSGSRGLQYPPFEDPCQYLP